MPQDNLVQGTAFYLPKKDQCIILVEKTKEDTYKAIRIYYHPDALLPDFQYTQVEISKDGETLLNQPDSRKITESELEKSIWNTFVKAMKNWDYNLEDYYSE